MASVVTGYDIPDLVSLSIPELHALAHHRSAEVQLCVAQTAYAHPGDLPLLADMLFDSDEAVADTAWVGLGDRLHEDALFVGVRR